MKERNSENEKDRKRERRKGGREEGEKEERREKDHEETDQLFLHQTENLQNDCAKVLLEASRQSFYGLSLAWQNASEQYKIQQ